MLGQSTADAIGTAHCRFHQDLRPERRHEQSDVLLHLTHGQGAVQVLRYPLLAHFDPLPSPYHQLSTCLTPYPPG